MQPARSSAAESTDFDALMDAILSSVRHDRVFVLGVCGMAGSGKTTLCRAIANASPIPVVRFDCDKFSAFSYADRQARIRQAETTRDPTLLEAEENPRHWYGWDDIQTALQQLRTQRAFSFDRAWNKSTGMLDERYAVSLPATGPVIVLCDGIFLLHAPVRQWLDATLCVDTSFELCLERGKMRSKENATLMNRLNRTYSAPYFEERAPSADFTYAAPR